MSGYGEPLLPTHASHGGTTSPSTGMITSGVDSSYSANGSALSHPAWRHPASLPSFSSSASATGQAMQTIGSRTAPTMPYLYTSPNILYAVDMLPELPVFRQNGSQAGLHAAVGNVQESGANKV
jgi:hypothetical protein